MQNDQPPLAFIAHAQVLIDALRDGALRRPDLLMRVRDAYHKDLIAPGA